MSRFFYIKFLFVWLAIALSYNIAFGKELVRIKVYPEHVGVFYNLRTQQFQAIAIFDDGSQEDYTDEVGWSLKANPLPRQDMPPGEVAKIDQNGLLTVLNSWGRVYVVATYPPQASAQEFPSLALSTLLLAKPVLKVAPATGPLGGANSVVVTSKKVICLDNGDLANVSLAGVPATGLNCFDDGRKVIVTAGAAANSKTGDVVVDSSAYGVSTKTNGYTYNPLPEINSVDPASGPLAGGNTVTITGLIGGGSNDITAVRIDGKAAPIVSQRIGEVVVEAPAGDAGGNVRVAVDSTRYGTAMELNAYKYTGVITNISPVSGPQAGGNKVLIDGRYLCGGGSPCDMSDITRVTLKGVEATVDIATQSSVIVTAGASANPGTGRVVIYSDEYGVIRSESPQYYTYNPVGNIISVIPAQGPTRGGTNVIIQGENLHNGTLADVEEVTLLGVQASVQSVDRNGTTLSVTSGASSVSGVGNVVIRSTSFGTTTKVSGFRYNAGGRIQSVDPAQGVAAGGEYVTVFGEGLGNGTDITSVQLCDIEATVVTQSPDGNSVLVRTGLFSGAVPATCNVEIVSTSRDVTPLVNGFTYN